MALGGVTRLFEECISPVVPGRLQERLGKYWQGGGKLMESIILRFRSISAEEFKIG